MNKLNPLLVDTEVVGQRLMKARGERSLDDVAKAAGVDRASIFHWENGREGGICHVASAGLAVGLSPDELLLKTPDAQVSAAERGHLRTFMVEMQRIEKLCQPYSALAVIAEHFTSVRRTLERIEDKPPVEPEWTPLQRQQTVALKTGLTQLLASLPAESALAELLDQVLNELDRAAAPRKSAAKKGRPSVIPGPGVADESPGAESAAPSKHRKRKK